MEQVRHFTQAYSQAPWRKQVMFIGLFLLIVVFIALVAGIYLDVTARTATIGREIQGMQADMAELRLKNADLATRLAGLTSAAEMEKRARSMGFEPIVKDQSMYLVVPGYIARQEVRLAAAPGEVKTVAAALPAEYTESLVDWLSRQVKPVLDEALELKP
ncbi:MAG: hypothetical protein L0Z70_04800 [Chloroflexi bacterium]|nr:hypothetical protein [Chloroflexota bacterium]